MSKSIIILIIAVLVIVGFIRCFVKRLIGRTHFVASLFRRGFFRSARFLLWGFGIVKVLLHSFKIALIQRVVFVVFIFGVLLIRIYINALFFWLASKLLVILSEETILLLLLVLELLAFLFIYLTVLFVIILHLLGDLLLGHGRLLQDHLLLLLLNWILGARMGLEVLLIQFFIALVFVKITILLWVKTFFLFGFLEIVFFVIVPFQIWLLSKLSVVLSHLRTWLLFYILFRVVAPLVNLLMIILVKVLTCMLSFLLLTGCLANFLLFVFVHFLVYRCGHSLLRTVCNGLSANWSAVIR